ncbi:hypothetical protein TrVE_jg2076 [Triparma verrucosa]|nr:hypothetical protein TrVE_jg2076 [Triparma verrucosa]
MAEKTFEKNKMNDVVEKETREDDEEEVDGGNVRDPSKKRGRPSSETKVSAEKGEKRMANDSKGSGRKKDRREMSENVEDDDVEEVSETPVKKRRGRPSKKTVKTVKVSKKSKPTVSDRDKRQRNEKKKAKEVVEEEESEEDDDDESAEVDSTPVKKRGRPSKKLKKSVEKVGKQVTTTSKGVNDGVEGDNEIKVKKSGRTPTSSKQKLKKREKKQEKEASKHIPSKPSTKPSTPPPPPKTIKFTSKSTKKTYHLPNPSSSSPRPNPYTSWCYKTGKWLDSRLNHHPNKSYKWSSKLEKERVEYFKFHVIDDNEVKMIERVIGGRRIGTEYEHLTEVCNFEVGVVRGYVRMGGKVEGHPVSFCCVFFVGGGGVVVVFEKGS